MLLVCERLEIPIILYILYVLYILEGTEHVEVVKNIKTVVEEINNSKDYRTWRSIQNEYAGKRILIVAHGGISIPVKCYFEGIPDLETLFPLCLGNCEVAKYS